MTQAAWNSCASNGTMHTEVRDYATSMVLTMKIEFSLPCGTHITAGIHPILTMSYTVLSHQHTQQTKFFHRGFPGRGKVTLGAYDKGSRAENEVSPYPTIVMFRYRLPVLLAGGTSALSDRSELPYTSK